jgi:hypothetical protein
MTKAKRISKGCCNIKEGKTYEGVLTNNFYFNPLVCDEYQGDHWIEGHWEIIKETQKDQLKHDQGKIKNV